MKQVLIIEDNKTDVLYFKTVLAKLGFTSIVSIDINYILQHVKEVDVVLLDIRIPGMVGDSILKKIRQVTNIPVVIFTALQDDSMRQKCLSLGADYYMEKPISVGDIKSVFENIINS